MITTCCPNGSETCYRYPGPPRSVTIWKNGKPVKEWGGTCAQCYKADKLIQWKKVLAEPKPQVTEFQQKLCDYANNLRSLGPTQWMDRIIQDPTMNVSNDQVNHAFVNNVIVYCDRCTAWRPRTQAPYSYEYQKARGKLYEPHIAVPTYSIPYVTCYFEDGQPMIWHHH